MSKSPIKEDQPRSSAIRKLPLSMVAASGLSIPDCRVKTCRKVTPYKEYLMEPANDMKAASKT